MLTQTSTFSMQRNSCKTGKWSTNKKQQQKLIKLHFIPLPEYNVKTAIQAHRGGQEKYFFLSFFSFKGGRREGGGKIWGLEEVKEIKAHSKCDQRQQYGESYVRLKWHCAAVLQG